MSSQPQQPQQPSKIPSILPPAPTNVPKPAAKPPAKGVPKVAPKIPSGPMPNAAAKILPPIKGPAIVRAPAAVSAKLPAPKAPASPKAKLPPGLAVPSNVPPKVKAPAIEVQSPPDILGEEAINELPNLPAAPSTAEVSSDFEQRKVGEDEDSYRIRVKYYQVALTYLGDQISRGTAELFGRLAVNRVKEDAHYPAHVEEILNFLDTKM